MTTPALMLRGVTVVAAALLASTAVLVAPASAANGTETSDQRSLVVTYDNGGRKLANATVRTVTGTPTRDGGCQFRFPKLELAPGQYAIEARQVETDYRACTTKIETGVPAETDAVQSGGDSERQSATVVSGRARADDVSIAATSSTGYFRHWWEDVVNLRVHEVKSNVTWTWGGTCVSSASGWADYWWLTTTQWSKYSSAPYLAQSCSDARVYTDATYQNSFFCWPGTVWSYYDNVTVQGKSDGWLVGWTDNTYTTYPFACPTLHYHTELKRVTN